MPLLTGLETTRRILHARPATRVLLLATHNYDAYAQHVIALGATGYLSEHASAEMLARAVRAAHNGNSFFSRDIAPDFQERQQPDVEGTAPSEHVAQLTSRETEVLRLVAEGRANKQTASELRISIKTVEKHRHNLGEKLGIHETAGLTRYAIATGIIQCTPLNRAQPGWNVLVGERIKACLQNENQDSLSETRANPGIQRAENHLMVKNP